MQRGECKDARQQIGQRDGGIAVGGACAHVRRQCLGRCAVVGARIAGPALIAEDETTTFVTRSYDATIDAARSIVLTRKTA